MKRIEQYLREDCRLAPDDLLLVGFSGGLDSLCLLHGLVSLGWPVRAAHFDHALRAESAQQAQQAARMAAEMGVACVVDRGDVPAFAQAQRLSIEEAARTLRYRFLFEQARRCGARAVAVAHHADDQVETVLMHLLRGAGLSGLKGMIARAILPEWDASIPLVRPLLGAWRTDIEKYCLEVGLAPLADPSNESLRFFRNRLRHELIPYLEGYNPNVRQVIWRTANTLAGDYALLEQQVDAAWRNCLLDKGPGYAALDLGALRAQEMGLQRNLLKRAIACLRPGLRDIDFEAVQRGVEFARQPSRSGEADLLDGVRLMMEAGRLYLLEQDARLPHPWPHVAHDFCGMLRGGELLDLGDGWRIMLDPAPDGNSVAVGAEDAWQAVLDAERLELPLQVRAVRAGERWQPLGMRTGRIKFSDFWINAGLPRRARAGWPVVFSGGQAVWVPGFRPAHFCRVTEQTQRALALHMFSPEMQTGN